MGTEIYLIRHGAPEYKLDNKGNKLMYEPEAPLSKDGRDQASSLSSKLPQLDVVYTSTFLRAEQTAEIIAEHKGLDAKSIIKDPSLADRFPKYARGILLLDALDENIAVHPEDETVNQHYERIINGFGAILDIEKGKDKKVGVVFHGEPIRFIIWELVEGREPIQEVNNDLRNSNYPLPGEAWQLTFDESKKLISSRLITREGNKEPGVAKW